jgi:ketosteroid isomerase-like protein
VVLILTKRIGKMRNVLVLILIVVCFMPLPALAQENSRAGAGNAALEKELFALELKWMKAEFDKKMTGPDSMGELWADDFFDVLPGGRVVNKQEMMDLMAKTDRQPGTGAFPDHFKLMAVYGNVALATDHTVIKGVDANGKIVVVREMGVLRMFVKEKGKWKVAGAGLVPIVSQ